MSFNLYNENSNRKSTLQLKIPAKALTVIILLVNSFSSQAQLCNGSLGDPVVDISFGSGGSSSPYVPPASYTYTSSACPDDGFYTITNSTSQCFGNTWFTLNNDHTGGGAFLLVNASYQPGDFFVTTVSGLCPNTTYEFAAWVLNIMKISPSILPNLTFRVETPGGVVLNSFNSGDIPVTNSPQWKQYGFYFTTPVGNPVIVLRITNNATGGIGNDLALDDITFRPCGARIASAISGFSSDTVNVCKNDNALHTYIFNANITSGYVDPLFQWQLSRDSGKIWNDIPGANLITYQSPNLQNVGSYSYRLTVVESSVANISSCRIASDALMVNVHPLPIANAGPDKVMLMNYPVTLSGSAEGEQVTYTWFPEDFMNNSTLLNPEVSPPSDMTYSLSVKSIWGCMSSDNVNVKVVRGIFVPNAFTPNGDGKNDRWEIPYIDPSFEGDVQVFNRWGQKVYRANSSPVSWDGNLNGEPQPAGVYSYVIFIAKYGIRLKGTFMLIR